MKIKHLFLGALALAATVVGCKPQGPDGEKLVVTPDKIEAAIEGSDFELNVEADCKWVVSTTAKDWIMINPSEGVGNATVKVSIAENGGAARSASIHFQKASTRRVSFDVTVNQEGGSGIDAQNVTVAEFLAAEVSTTQYYRISGEVSGNINLTYGNFDVVDETGSVYVYGLDNIAEVKDKLVKGAKITVAGTRGDYNGKAEMMNGHCEKIETVERPEAENATVAQFIAAADPDKYYRLSGKVGGSINTTYGNFDLTDETGTVYVYGLTNIDKIKDKLLNGADIVVTGTYLLYQKEGQPDKIEMVNGYCESIEGGDKPEPGPGPDPEGDFESSITWTLGTNSYDNTSSGQSKQTAVVNGVEVSNLLKLGKSSAAGTATLHIPAGTAAISFYAYAWKGTEATLKFTLGESEGSLALTANDGLTGNPPYTMTIDAEEDLYALNLGSALAVDTDLTVTTDGVARVVLFGINPYSEGGEEEHYTLDQVNAMDCYIYGYGDGRYVCDADLYVSDVENNTYSHNLDIYVPLIINEQTKIAGNHVMNIDPDYYKYYGYTTNEGDYSPFTEGTMNISYVSQSVDSYGDPVYFYNVVIAGKLQNGQDFNLTINNCRVYATDIDDEEWPYIELTDGTKAGMSGKAVKTVKETRMVVKRK